MSSFLDVRAGKTALALIRDNGWDMNRVQVLAGAAGGPKWLSFYALDQLIFGELLQDRTEPLYLLGSSIGAWRFAAASASPAALERLQAEYIAQRYSARPGPQEVSAEGRRILDAVIGKEEVRRILRHSCFRLNILSARSALPVFKGRSRFSLGAALGGAALLNAVSRKSLNWFFERTIFHHPADGAFFADLEDFPVRSVPLGTANLKKAILASGSIPLVMEEVRDIPGTSPGVYWDGGIVDYHMNLDYPGEDDRLILFPHYTSQIIPGWFDKKIFWRGPNPAYLERVLMVNPAAEFVEQLPYRKIPDRKDFPLFRGREAERIAYWKEVVDRSRHLADEFYELITTGKIRERVRPLI